MFDIVGGISCFYTHSKTLSHIVAKMEDQSYDTLMALGRGKNYEANAGDGLKYNLPGGVLVLLRTD